MISFAQIETTEKQKISAAGEEAADAKTEDFAAFFAAPAEPANDFSASGDDSDSTASGAFETTPGFSPAAVFSNLAPEIPLAQNAAGEENEKNINFKSLLDLQPETGLENAAPSRTNAGAFSAEAGELIKTYLESGKAEVVSDAQNPGSFALLSEPAPEAAIGPGKDEGAASGTLPQLFRELAGEIRNTAPVEANTSESGGALNSDQPEIETPKDKKAVDRAADPSVFNFDKLFAAGSKEQKVIETAHATRLQADRIFEQIEPKILQILNLETIANEKKILKMRLYPAELGTLEIHLEKDASGALRVQLQTETETARQIINQSLEQLRDALKNSGWLIERLDVSCAPFSSAAGEGSRENESRQFERIENQMKTQMVSIDSTDGADDLKPYSQNRLLSVRA